MESDKKREREREFREFRDIAASFDMVMVF